MIENKPVSTDLKTLYMLDTNVLLLDPNSMFAFEKSTVGIPAVVLEELDTFKKEGTERGRMCRVAIRNLDSLREKGSLSEGVNLDNGAQVKVFFLEKEPPIMPFRLSVNDNEILLIAVSAQAKGYQVTFVSNDLNARVKADALGLKTIDYQKEQVTKDDFYRGWQRMKVPSIQLKRDLPENMEQFAKEAKLETNEYVLIEGNHNEYNYKAVRYLGGDKFRTVEEPNFKWPIKSRNPQQLMALDALLDDSIPFVTLFGPAGTGKTFLALLAGLHKVLIEGVYKKIFVSRPVVPLGRDIGYLPGDLKEKLHSWMLPIYDNMELIMDSADVKKDLDKFASERRGGENRHDHRDRRFSGKAGRDFHHDRHDRSDRSERHDRYDRYPRRPVTIMDELEQKGKLSIEAITYMRGRSLPNQYILIDEAQNLTAHEVKTIVSRAGEGSKVVLVGDPYQIDSPYLDFSSNGIVVCNQKFKGQRLFATVYLDKSERSELSQLASDLL